MGMIDDMLKALDRVEIWKQLQDTPKRIAALEERIAELEGKLGGKWPAEVCRYCGARSARLAYAYPGVDAKGNAREVWKCSDEACGKEDQRLFRPGTR